MNTDLHKHERTSKSSQKSGAHHKLGLNLECDIVVMEKLNTSLTSLQSRTMGWGTLSSCWLPSIALLVLLLRTCPFLNGTLEPDGSSLQGDVGEVERTRVFSAATSAWRTSICKEDWTRDKLIVHPVESCFIIKVDNEHWSNFSDETYKVPQCSS